MNINLKIEQNLEIIKEEVYRKLEVEIIGIYLYIKGCKIVVSYQKLREG